MPPKRPANRKHQTKLSFSPLPASSPGAASLSPQVRDRAAAVIIESSPLHPAKKRKLDFGRSLNLQELDDSDSDSDIPRRNRGLPTPKKSFQSNVFTPDKGEVGRGMALGIPVSQRRNGMFGSSDNEILVSSNSSSESLDPQRQPYKPPSSKKKKTRKERTTEAESEKGEEELTHSKSSRISSTRKKNRVSLHDTESEDEPMPSRTRMSSRKKAKNLRDASTDDSVLGKLSDKSYSQMDSGNDTMPDTTPPKHVRGPPNRRQRAGSFEMPDVVNVETEDSEDDIAPTRGRRQRVTQHLLLSGESDKQQQAEEEEEEEEAIKTPGRRLLRMKARDDDRQEKEDLKEDLDFLISSPPSEQGGLRNKPLNKRQKALEALRRQRACAAGEPSSSATPARRRKVVLSDSDSELEVVEDREEDAAHDKESEESDDIEEVSDDTVPKTRIDQTNAFDMFREDDEDAGFIDDDANDVIGEPSEFASLPIEFSSLSRAKPRDLFKHAVEWMVQKKINPAFTSDDPIYDLTFRKLDDEVNGLANSKYSSSVWTPDFTRALRARPDVTIDDIGKHLRAFTSPHCEACNRKSHPATFNICFTGSPYQKDTLEPLAEDTDSSTDSDSDANSGSEASDERSRRAGEKPTYDATGELIPPESRVFTVGSTCKANAQMAHTLHHWRHHLNSWVVDYLVRTGHCTPEKLVERDNWSVRKRHKYANKIVDEMEAVGEVRKLHRLYKDQVDFALEARNDYKSGWGKR